ncbi:hypothetical protein DQ04_07041000 [Trypanosoma grayi]|uniref:hypothetical protein n=1 Tax=Trypanosoma grayi TaxID=71804 RepID=UPI0004F4A4B8|nr:hypothetical protein DQ04_07041000 [Trypanosoma grayi]KEG08497.1 hypothetical protein DQ04_07041000 [Trypanosoma grayi]
MEWRRRQQQQQQQKEGMALSSRGILIAGVTNRARTQMAEAILRRMTAGAVFIKSGGVHHEATVHPLAVKVMHDIGIDISGQSVSSLTSARRQRDTYDVYVSIDSSYERKMTDKSQRPTGDIQRCAAADAHDNNNKRNDGQCQNLKGGHDKNGGGEEEEAVYYDPLLVPSTPSHWSIGADATDVRRHWQVWSPRDPSIFHETSTRKFQDHHYEGEPLFMQLRASDMRNRAKVSERWEMDELATRYALERHSEHEARFVRARETLLWRCEALLRRLEGHYGERLLLDGGVEKQASGRGAQDTME